MGLYADCIRSRHAIPSAARAESFTRAAPMTWRPSVSQTLALLLGAVISTRCGGSPVITSPTVVNAAPSANTTPTPPAPASTAPTVVNIKVGVLGNAAASVAPGDSLQLWAQATYSDDTTADVTNAAAWQSSDPALATVSHEGVLKAGMTEGTVEARASVGQISGGVRTDIRRRGCQASTLSPGDLIFNAFSTNYQNVAVTTPSSDCRWTASSDADWLRFYVGDRARYDPGRSGSGTYTLALLANNLLDGRTGRITVAFTDGARLVQTVRQEGSAVCSYVVLPPDEVTFTTREGGLGAFTVIATPSTCRWTATSSYPDSYLKITAGSPGMGPGRVNFAAYPTFNTYGYDITITVSGLSGISPPAYFRVHLRP
jgi:hypothetical protein